MGFFDVPEPPPPPPPPRRSDLPEWVGPPEGVLPGLSAQRPVLFHTESAHMMVDRILGYPSGLELVLMLRLRDGEEMDEPPWEFYRRRRPQPLSDDFLRFGMLLSDGAKWTNLDWHPRRPDQEPSPPVVAFRSGGHGEGFWRGTYWMWPLPPPGPLEMFVSWPGHDKEETSVVVDADELRERAAAAQQLWSG